MTIALRPYQSEALAAVRKDWRSGLRRTLVSMPTGTGKCSCLSTFVWSDGLRTFGELFDLRAKTILAPGGVCNVNGWYDDGVREGLKLTTDCGIELDGTFEHRLWVRTDDGYEGWRKLVELAGDEYVAVARGRADWGSLHLSSEDAFLLGLVVADGCFIQKGDRSCLTIHKHPVVLEAVRATMRSWASHAGCNSDKIPSVYRISKKCGRVDVSAKGLREWTEERFSFTLGFSETRTVPVSVLRGTRETVQNFLRGYFAGDGDASEVIEVTSTSKRLLEQVQQLLLGLGVWSALRSRKSVGQPAWRLTVRDTEAFAREVGIGHPGTTKHDNYAKLIAKKRNTNVDVVPGVGALIREMGKLVPNKHKRSDAWRMADAYYDGTRKKPSYAMLEELVRGAPDSLARCECVRILKDNYAWSRIASIEPSTCHRIDCEVDVEHAFIGNGLVNHNTWLFVFAIWGAISNGLRCLILENTDELIEQTVEKLQRVGVNPGVIKAGRNEWTSEVVVASVQTLSKSSRLYNLPPNHFGLVITDEAHYANAPSYQRVLWYFANSFHMGVTATPFRGDKRSLAGAGWNVVSYVYTMQQAIKDKWLAPVKFVRVDTGIELKGVGRSTATTTSEKDFNAKMLAKIINTTERNNAIVDAALKNLVVASGPFNQRMRRSIAFCADVAHAVDLANAFRRRGIEAFAVYGAMKEKHRRVVLKAHRLGRFPVLTNCNILTTGYDDPALEAVIMARPTESKVLYLQCLGRGLRLSPDTGKTDCVALDMVDVARKHTLTIGSELLALEEALDEAGVTKGGGEEASEQPEQERAPMPKPPPLSRPDDGDDDLEDMREVMSHASDRAPVLVPDHEEP